MADFKFDIIKKLGDLSENSKGWKREMNIISWNNKATKIDIREWDETHEKMGKGITLNKEEVRQLRDILNLINMNELDME